jgi:hypothetical protein
MNDDFELLHAYSQRASEGAFAEVVGRYKGLVYASALPLVDTMMISLRSSWPAGKSVRIHTPERDRGFCAVQRHLFMRLDAMGPQARTE